MPVSLKPPSEQTIVITGASSGIGLATARMAAAEGARVVLSSRNEETLAAVTSEINAADGKAIYVATGVGDRAQVQKSPTRLSSTSAASTPGSTTQSWNSWPH